MRRHAQVFVLFLLLVACGGRAADDPKRSAYDRAVTQAEQGEFEKAAELYELALREEKDPAKLEEAELRLANLQWRILGKSADARSRLVRVAPRAKSPAPAYLQLARIERNDKKFDAARAAASQALATAKTKRERWRAQASFAAAVVEDPKRPSPEAAAQQVAALRRLIAEQGPTLNVARLLATAGILAGDDTALLEGVDAYYHVSASSGPPEEIEGAHRQLKTALTSGSRAAAIAGLAGIRFFREAALLATVTNDKSPATAEVVAYNAALERIKSLTETYYRDIALDRDDANDLRDGVEREVRTLWPSLLWPGAPPKFKMATASDELARRFGLYINIGKTSGHIDAHIAHRVVDARLKVDQYGHAAEVRFVNLDGVVSNGYAEWASDGASGDGGWGTASEIYQVRPRYADGPLRKWQSVADEEIRAEREKRIAEQSAEDRRKGPIATFDGTSMRLERLYLEDVMAELKARHAQPAALRDAFLARYERDEFQYSILLHEGRHAIDAKSGENYKTPELEYRAKLSAIALSDAPRLALSAVLGETVGDGSPHGIANERLFKGLAEWMAAHRREIAGVDDALPLLSQADKLTPAQIRAAARSLDPLAK